MARPLRIEFPGALYHVISRGNEKGPIVRDDSDREKRLDWLRRTVEVYGWRVHAFVLMTTHDHLFVETPEGNLSAGMQHDNGSDTGYFHRRHRRSGHLFQGRFKGHLIEEEGYFREVSRYIHLNPVRAKRVGQPEAWRWSSCPGYLRTSRRLDWMCYDRVLGEFGRQGEQARRAYGRFLQAALEQSPRSPFSGAVGGLIVGTQEFVDRIRRMIRDKPEDGEVPQRKQVRNRPELALDRCGGGRTLRGGSGALGSRAAERRRSSGRGRVLGAVSLRAPGYGNCKGFGLPRSPWRRARGASNGACHR